MISASMHVSWTLTPPGPHAGSCCCRSAGVKVDSKLPFSPGHIAGSCNDYLPGGEATFARFLWNVHMLAANGMYVLIDDHSNFDKTIVDNYDAWLTVRLQPLCRPCCLPTSCFLALTHSVAMMPFSVDLLTRARACLRACCRAGTARS